MGARAREAGGRGSLGRAPVRAALVAAIVVTSTLVPLARAHGAAPLAGLTAVSPGGNHTCAVTTSGGAKCWGRDANQQLGDGLATVGARLAPWPVAGLSSGVTAISAGSAHTCAVVAGGVKCWGYNSHGQLGRGGAFPTGGEPTPADVVGMGAGSGIVAVAAGGEHTCALSAGGAMKCWGRNDAGQLGVGDGLSRFTPTQVVGLTAGVAAIAANGKHTCALLGTGAVKCWGLNMHGSVGDGTTQNRGSPANVSGLGSGVAAISLGGQHSCALLAGGGVKCWGFNSSGQLGDGTTTDRLVPTNVGGLSSGVGSIAAGGSHSCALTGTQLRCWGNNADGQVGDGSTTRRLLPTSVPEATTNVASVTGGRAHSCVKLTSGAIKCWGDNESGQLGDGSTLDLYGPFVPDPPRLVVAAAGDHQATLNWLPPLSDGGFALSDYLVTATPALPAPVHVAPPLLAATITGLTNGATYRFKVLAVNSAGQSRAATSNAVTPAGLPGAPTGLGVTTGDRSATVSWKAAFANGSPISKYRVVASPGGRSATVSGSARKAKVTGLTNGATYTFTVRATNGVGTGPGALISAKLPQPKSGYWMLGADGRVYAFGASQPLGSAVYVAWSTSTRAVAISPRLDGSGYWIVDNAGGVRAFGTAHWYGDHPSLRAGERVSTIASTPSGKGYWLFTNRGRAASYGDAKFFGDMRNTALNGPVIASSATPTGRGYFMVASDGGVFTFGDAVFHGSTGNIRLNKPVVGLSPTPTNRGYWLVASDGGVFAFGDAPFRGSTGNIRLNKPVNGLVPFGNGYLMVASDGGVFNFSNKPFYGSLGANPPAAPIIGIAAFAT